MHYKKILITGASGKLGKVLLKSDLKNREILSPTHSLVDITNLKEVSELFEKNQIDAVIHCAAMTNGAECEKNPSLAININSIATGKLAEEAIKRKIRFIYISTDYVYSGTSGNYKETDTPNPVNYYAWSKFAGECSVRLVPNHCIIRTSFFDSENIPFASAPNDSFCSKITISDLVNYIIRILDSEFIGTINVGQERISLYDLYKKYKSNINQTTMDEIHKISPAKRAKDSSLDITLLKKLFGEAKHGN